MDVQSNASGPDGGSDKKMSDTKMIEGRPAHNGEKPAFLVFVFSLIPGAGQMYLGLMTRGVQIMTFFFGVLAIVNLIGSSPGGMLSLVITPVTWFYSFFDTFRISGRLARGEKVEDEPVFSRDFLKANAKVIGWGLIVLGGLGALRQLTYFTPFLSSYIWSSIMALLMVGLGIWLITRERV